MKQDIKPTILTTLYLVVNRHFLKHCFTTENGVLRITTRVGIMRSAHGLRDFAAAQVQLPPFITGPRGARELRVSRDESTDAQAHTGCRSGAWRGTAVREGN
jgi:hypothetical protein